MIRKVVLSALLLTTLSCFANQPSTQQSNQNVLRWGCEGDNCFLSIPFAGHQFKVDIPESVKDYIIRRYISNMKLA